MEKPEYCRIPISFVIKYSEKLPFDIFIKLSEEKIIKLSNENENISTKLPEYEKKGLTFIYVKREDFDKFSAQLSKSMEGHLADKFFETDYHESLKDIMEDLDSGYQMIYESLMSFGANEETFELCKSISKNAVRVVSESQNLFHLVNRFKKQCNEEYLRSLTVMYTAICIVDCFEWRSLAIKEKISMACILCDLALDPGEVKMHNDYELGKIDKSELSQNILDHPKNMAEIFNRSNSGLFPEEIKIIIEQHHEIPNGKGYPLGIPATKVTLLSATYIVARKFILLMEEADYSVDKKEEIFTNIADTFKEGSYKKVSDALFSLFGMHNLDNS